MASGVELANAYVSMHISGSDVSRDLRRQFGKVERDADAAGKRAGKKLGGGLGAGLKAGMAGLAAGLAAGGVVAGFKDIIGKASELEQSIGGVGAVFGSQAREIESASKRAAKNLGLSKNAYNELATTLGAGLKNKGIKDYADQTQNLIGIGADLAAQFGGSTQQAVEALSSALRGESDPIERYGVALNETAVNAELARQGAQKVGGQYTETQKTAARLALITKQTADAQGAFGREADTAAGKQARLGASWENIKTTLGTALLPTFSNIVGKVSEFVTQMDEGTGAGGRFRDIVSQVASSVMGVVGWVKRYSDILVPLAGGVLAVVAAMRTWKAVTAAMRAAQFALNIVMSANPLGLVVLAIVGLVAALTIAYKKNETFRNIVNRVWASVKSAISGVVTWFKDNAWPAMRDTFNSLAAKAKWLWENGIRPAFTKIKSGVAAVRDAFGAAKNAIGKTWSGLTDAVSGPITAAVNFIRKNFIGPIASMLDKVGLDSLANGLRSAVGAGGLKPTGKNTGRSTKGGTTSFATGGYTGPGGKYQPAGIVHADEFVIRKESQNDLARRAPGFLDALNTYGSKALPGYSIGGKVGGLNADFVKRLAAFNAAAGGRYRVISGLRTRAEQVRLYNLYLSGRGNLAARPGTSRHESGIAADLAPSNAKDVHQALAAQYGLHFPVRGESWHIEPMGKVKGAMTAIAGLVSSAADLLGPLKDKALGFLKGAPAGLWGQTVAAVGKKFVGGLASKASSALGSMLGAGMGSGTAPDMPGKGVSRWSGVARQAMKLAGLPESFLPLLLQRMQLESGGNPNAQNNWDSNARAGMPSQGLMQVIPPTFRAYAGQLAYRGIRDPLANIYAAIRYSLSRYGINGLGRAWGGLKGYANGGITDAGMALVGEKGPELVRFSGGQKVYPADKTAAMLGGPARWHPDDIDLLAQRQAYYLEHPLETRTRSVMGSEAGRVNRNPRKGVYV